MNEKSGFLRREREQALSLLDSMLHGDMIPGMIADGLEEVISVWGHWTARYDSPQGEDLAWLMSEGVVEGAAEGGKAWVLVSYDAPETCPSGPCGESRALRGVLSKGLFEALHAGKTIFLPRWGSCEIVDSARVARPGNEYSLPATSYEILSGLRNAGWGVAYVPLQSNP